MEDSVGAQIAVVVLNSIGTDNPNDFGTRLFNYWGIGQAGIDNGLLILLVMDQRRVEFITGNGLEEILPDVLCYQIQQELMVPLFKAGDYSNGILDGLLACANVITTNEIYQAPPPPVYDEYYDLYEEEYYYNPWYDYFKFYALRFVLPVTGIFLFMLLMTLFTKDYYKKYKYIRVFDFILFPILLPSIYFIYMLTRKIIGLFQKRHLDLALKQVFKCDVCLNTRMINT